MSSLGSLVVSLAMNTASFMAAANKSQQSMLKLAGTAGKMGAAIGVAMSTAASTAALFVRAALNAADANIKTAQAVGLTVEAYTSLAYAANLSGQNHEAFSSALKKLAKNASDAAAGTGDAKDGFAAMGIEVKNSTGGLKSQDELLLEVADKFSKYKDGAEKSALAQRLFGKAGAAMIPMLNSGSAGIEAMRREADALGITMDTKTAKAAEQFNDNLTRLGAVGGGLANRLMRELSPTLVSVSDNLVDSAKSTELFDKVARSAATGVRLLATGGALIAAAFKTVGEYLGGIGAQAVAFFSGNFKEALRIGQMANADFASNLKSAASGLDAIWDESAAKVAAGAEANSSLLAAPMIKAAEKTDAALKKLKKYLEEQRMLAQYASGNFLESDAEVARLARYNEELARYFELNKHGMEQFALSGDNNITGGFFNESEAETARLQRYADNVAKTTTQVTDYAKKAGENMQSYLGSTLFDVLDGKFTDIGSAFANMLKRMVAEALAADLMSSLFGKGSGGNLMGLFGAFGGLFGGARANGGPVSAGKSYLVGERGPELFTPSGSGNITANGAAGVTINQTINVGQGVSRAEVFAAALQAKDAAKSELMQTLTRRGVSFA